MQSQFSSPRWEELNNHLDAIVPFDISDRELSSSVGTAAAIIQSIEDIEYTDSHSAQDMIFALMSKSCSEMIPTDGTIPAISSESVIALSSQAVRIRNFRL